MHVLIMLLLALSVVYFVYKEFRLQDDVGAPRVPCMIQHICDDGDDVYKRRREYREWLENCNQLFGKESNVSHERVDGAA